MIITQASLEALRTGFSLEFNNGLAKAAPVSGPLVTPITSTTKVNTYGFLGDMPIFRKWIGDKRIRSVREKEYSLKNEDYEATIGIHKNAIRDDNLGLYGPMVAGWGQDAGQLQDRLAFDALKAGDSTLCWDGQYFFDTDHPVEYQAGVVSNISGDNSNASPWYLVDLSKPLKPLIFQNRQSPVFNMVIDETDSHVFKTGEYLMGGEARGAAGYTLWQLAHKCTGPMDAANYQAAKAAMIGLKDDEGEPLEVMPTHVVYGVPNEAAALTLFKAQNQAGGASNIYFNAVDLIEARRLP